MLSLEKIKSRNLKTNYTEDEALKTLTHVRLDRENIAEIDNLEVLNAVTHLYLQKNCIKVIENLECLSSTLRFLTLARNNISVVQGLKTLQFLAFLDLSENLIEDFHPSELPQSLAFLVLTGNKCTALHNYRHQLISNLPHLKSIDGELIISSDESSSEEEDSDSEVSNVEDHEKIKDISLEMLNRSSSRMDEVLEEHHSRLENLNTSQSDSKESLLAHVQEQMKNMLNAMLDAEKVALNSFDIPTVSASRPVKTPTMSRSSSAATIAADPVIADVHEDTQSRGSKKYVSRPSFSSVGTTSGGTNTFHEYTITPKIKSRSSQKIPRRNPRIHRDQKTLLTLKEKSKVNKNSAVVRIPGARPFLKS